jgi:putative glutamine amidotransferase
MMAISLSTSPVIGIPCYWHDSENLLGGHGSAMPDSYIRALELTGCAPMLIPVSGSASTLRSLYDRVDGLLMAGGPDVDPTEYGQQRHPALRKVTPFRDRMEFALIERALLDEKPLFCICRGLQVLNVALGGTLWQDLSAQVPGAHKHDRHPESPPDRLAHEVVINPGSRLSTVVGADVIAVNSLHHQAIDRVGDGLRVSARATDGIIEAAEGMGSRFLLGVQWHPEWLAHTHDSAKRLFVAFADACRDAR